MPARLGGTDLMSAYAAFGLSVEDLVQHAKDPNPSRLADIRAALDGQASTELRRLVPIENLRVAGAFFTSSDLAQAAWQLLAGTITARSVVVDPACGAGALLLPAVDQFAATEGADTIDLSSQIRGADLHLEFVEVTRSRLRLKVAEKASDIGDELQSNPAPFGRIGIADALQDMQSLLQDATHVLLNPPYHKMLTPPGMSWSSGSVNSAAVFALTALSHLPPGAHIVAILPDVLRSGSRYERWRAEMLKRGAVNDLRIWGQFDAATDVHVFVLHMTSTVSPTSNEGRDVWSVQSPGTISSESISDHFHVSVGTVVPHRHPETGPVRAFATARGLPKRAVVNRIAQRRRFDGNCHQPPFVLVRRTSRPGESPRARGTVVTGTRPVAVDNHLLVLTPVSGGLEICQEALAVLKSEVATKWLDDRYQCRHLSVRAIEDLPWRTE